MASSMERPNIQQLCLVSTAGIICIIGLMIHIFIVGVGIIDRMRGRPLTTTDLLITCLGTSRIIFQFASLLLLFSRIFCEEYSAVYEITATVIIFSSMNWNNWLLVFLSVFYSLKISNFSNIFFLHLKNLISQRVLGLIIISMFLSIVLSSGQFLFALVITSQNSTQSLNIHIIERGKWGAFVLSNVLPFILYAISSFALLGSLCLHIHRMTRDQNVRSHQDTYFKTMKFIIVSFFCFALYVGTNISNMFGMYNFLAFYGPFLVLNCFPVLHSIYIIYMTARLRGHFFKILHSVTKCLLFGGSEPTSGVQLQIISQ